MHSGSGEKFSMYFYYIAINSPLERAWPIYIYIQSHVWLWPPIISGDSPWAASFDPAYSFFLYILTDLSSHLSNAASDHSITVPFWHHTCFQRPIFLFVHVACLAWVGLTRVTQRWRADTDISSLSFTK